MKAKVKTLLVVAGTAIALVAASQSVNPPSVKGHEKVKCYSDEEVRYLMKANRWPRQAAEEVLDLSCLASGDQP